MGTKPFGLTQDARDYYTRVMRETREVNPFLRSLLKTEAPKMICVYCGEDFARPDCERCNRLVAFR